MTDHEAHRDQSVILCLTDHASFSYCAILPTMPCVSSGVHRRVVEGSGMGSPGCVVHVYVYGD